MESNQEATAECFARARKLLADDPDSPSLERAAKLCARAARLTSIPLEGLEARQAEVQRRLAEQPMPTGGGGGCRTPQSVQSVPKAHESSMELSPPSLHTPLVRLQSSEQTRSIG